MEGSNVVISNAGIGLNSFTLLFKAMANIRLELLTYVLINLCI